jgi:hypothetical protein
MVRVNWDRTMIPLPLRGFYTLHVGPEPDYPFGRKGLAIASAWGQLAPPGAAGLVILDGDVAVDPRDVAEMLAAVDAEPGAVHVAPVKLWPASTKKDRWVWGHGKGQFTRDDPDDPDVFGFSFTYLPRKLLEATIKAGLSEWTYPNVDRLTRRTATQLRLPVRVVRGASPKHLNY